MNIKVLKLFAVAVVLVAGCRQPTATKPLTIGDKAPPLDVGEWISLGNGQFKPVTTFEPGKVYVVDFWATWCAPCLALMPHLIETQEKYLDKGVQVISITDEDRKTVDKLLTNPAPHATGKDKTFGDMTSHWSGGSDPDGSVQGNYMQAIRQQSIPFAFIIGKDGRVEWAGHAADIDEPLEAVVQDKWDRDVFKLEFDGNQVLKDMDEEIGRTVGKSKLKKGNAEYANAVLPVVEKYESLIKSEPVLLNLRSAKLELLLTGDLQAERTTDLFKAIVKDEKASAVFKHEMAWKVYEMSMESDKINKALLQAAIDAIPDILTHVDNESHATVLDTKAHLQHLLGDDKAALATAEEAYKKSNEAPEYLKFIEELKSEKD